MQRRYESSHELTEKLKNLKVIRGLKSKGLKGQVYLVGGAIRDLVLGLRPRDLDFSISEEEDITKFEEFFRKKSFVLGKKPLHAYRLCHRHLTVDITLMNGSIEEDLKRRDLTINALAYDLKSEKIVDILDGLDDLKNRIIRFPDESVIILDPLRMLKALRHFATLWGFSLVPQAKEAISRNKERIKNVAGERIKYELDIILGSDLAYETLKIAEETGLLYEIFPELKELKEFDQKKGLKLRTLEHALFGLKFLKKYNRITSLKKDEILQVAYALLFHDLGKPYTFSFDQEKGIVHFFGHEKISVELAKNILDRLRFSNQEMRAILELVKNHMWIFLLNKETPTLRATRRLILKMGKLTPSLILLTICDMFGTTEGKRNETTSKVLKYSRETMGIYKEFLKKPPPKIVDGYDLLSMGFKEGPFLGKVLNEIREKQLAGEIRTREEALEYAKKRLDSS